MKNITRLLIFILPIYLTGCLITGGPGSIKRYRYSTKKDELEKAVMTVIKINANICRDSIKNFLIAVTKGKNDTIIDDYYNDGKNFMTIKIKDTTIEYEYIFRYYGNEEYWKTSPSSEIFICYVFDDKGNGGSKGDGKFEKTPKAIKNNMIKLFETEFIDKINKELNLTPSNYD